VARPVAQRVLELLRQVGGVDHDVAHAGAGERLELPLDQAPAAGRQQRLGRRVGQRTHSFAAPGGQDQGSQNV
jgi:hypothetical protein